MHRASQVLDKANITKKGQVAHTKSERNILHEIQHPQDELHERDVGVAPAVAAAYLMEVKRVTGAKAALSMIEEARPWVEVAKGLVDELRKFEVELNGGSSAPIDIADATTIGLPSSFLDSSFSSKAEYEASLKLSDSERLAAELSAATSARPSAPAAAAET